MTLARFPQTKYVYFTCDDCGDILDTEEADFNDARDVLKKNKWVIKKEDDEWRHYCPLCQ